MITDSPEDRWQRIVRDKRMPSLLMVAGLDVCKPSLDVLTGWAGNIAGRQQVDIDGTATSDGPGQGAPVRQVRRRRDVSRDHVLTRGITPAQSVVALTRATASESFLIEGSGTFSPNFEPGSWCARTFTRDLLRTFTRDLLRTRPLPPDQFSRKLRLLAQGITALWNEEIELRPESLVTR